MRREFEPPPPPEEGPGPDDPVVEHHRELQKARQTRVAKLLVVLFLLIVFIVFIIQNSDRTRIDYVFFNRDTRLIWIMLTCGVVGGIIGYLIGRPGKQVRVRRKDADEKR